MSSKVQAILSYLGIFWFIAFFAGREKRDHFSVYHLKQGLGLFVSTVIFYLILGLLMFVAPTLAFIVNLLSLMIVILMVVGILHATNRVEKPLPIIGVYFKDKFNFIDQYKNS